MYMTTEETLLHSAAEEHVIQLKALEKVCKWALSWSNQTTKNRERFLVIGLH